MTYDVTSQAETSNPDTLEFADACPPWRLYANKKEQKTRLARTMDLEQREKGKSFLPTKGSVDDKEPSISDLVNAALILRRPILVTGDAGVGKSSLAYSVAWKKSLGNVLLWPITSRSTLNEGLYQYATALTKIDPPLLTKTDPLVNVM